MQQRNLQKKKLATLLEEKIAKKKYLRLQNNVKREKKQRKLCCSW